MEPYNMSDNDWTPSPSATDKELVELANKMSELQCKEDAGGSRAVQEKKECEEQEWREVEEHAKEEAERMCKEKKVTEKEKKVTEKEKSKKREKGSQSGCRMSIAPPPMKCY